jgi:hypothetical protein
MRRIETADWPIFILNTILDGISAPGIEITGHLYGLLRVILCFDFSDFAVSCHHI